MTRDQRCELLGPEETCPIHGAVLDVDAIRGVVCPRCDAEEDAAVGPILRAIIGIGLVIAAVSWLVAR